MNPIRFVWALLPLLFFLGGCDGGPTAAAGTAVDSIAVTPAAPQVQPGGSVQLSVVLMDARGNALPGEPVFWASADSSIATVSPSGVLLGRNPGTTQIAASVRGVSQLITATVAPPGVASVVVEPSSVTLTSLSDTVRFTASARDAAGNPLPGRSVTWSSTAPVVAAVSSSGVATALANGTTRISAVIDGITGAATLNVAQQVARIALTPPSVALGVGDTARFTAVPLDARGSRVASATVGWGSSSTVIAPVSPTGLVTGVSTGQATITASAGSVAATANVAVALVPVGTVEVTPRSPTLKVGESVVLTATVRDQRGNLLPGRDVSWKSDNLGIARVDASGRVTGQGAGTTTITASSGGQSGSTTVTVAALPPASVATVVVSPSSTEVAVGGSTGLSATLKDASGNTLSGRAVRWSSSNTAVARADDDGTVRGIAPGSATITAESEGKRGTATVNVPQPPPAPVATVVVTPPSAEIATGDTKKFTAVARDASGTALVREFEWSSSNTAVATVTSDGTVRAVAPGSATITAEAEGKRGTATVTVPQPPPPAGTAPSVQTGGITNREPTSATLNGNVDPKGESTSAWFEWGTDAALQGAQSTPRQTVTRAGTVSAPIEGLDPGTPYYYRIVATSGDLTSRGEIRRIDPVPAQPAAPTNLRAEFVDDRDIRLFWKDNAGNEEGFRVYRKFEKGNYIDKEFKRVRQIPFPNTESDLDSGLNKGATYHYYVVAYNAQGESAPTDVISVTVPDQKDK